MKRLSRQNREAKAASQKWRELVESCGCKIYSTVIQPIVLYGAEGPWKERRAAHENWEEDDKMGDEYIAEGA